MTQQNTPDRLAYFSQQMAVMTLFLMAIMLLMNGLCWIYPILNSAEFGYGLGFGLTDQLISYLLIDTTLLPWWQIVGGIILSSLPLLALVMSLLALYRLFQTYSRREYFSQQTAVYFGRIGKGVILWVLLDFICEPLLSLWLTFNAPEGERLITVGFTTTYIVALFLAGCITVIARILSKASAVHSENQAFV